MKNFDFKKLDKRNRAMFINSVLGFKPAILVGTIAPDGVHNLSIINSAFHLGADPSLVGFIIRPDTATRNTLDNIRQTRLCTFNHVNESIVDKAHQTSARYPADISEFDEVDLSPQFIDEFEAPFVGESHIKMALKFVREIHIEENSTHMIICEIKNTYLPSEVIGSDGFVELEKANTILTSGLDSYYRPKLIARYKYAKPDMKTQLI